MGMFDKIWAMRNPANNTEAKQPKAPENLKKPETSALNRDVKGEVMGFDTSMPTLPISSVRKYLATQYERLSKDLEDARKSGLPSDVIDQKIKEDAQQTAELKKLEDAIDKRMNEPDAKEMVYAGKEVVIPNPYFEMGKVGMPETAAANDNAVEEVPDIDAQRKDLDVLMQKRDVLMKKRDVLMHSVKETVSLFMQQEIAGTKKYAEAVDEKAVYPNYFPENIEKANAADALRAKAAGLEQASKETRKGEPLREVLDQLDDVQEEIMNKQRNIEFIEKKYGTAEKREAA